MLNGPRGPWDADGRMKFAGRRPQQTHNSQSWETAVGGSRSAIHAIYGSSDRATLDYTNSTLCKVVDNDTGMRDGIPFIPTTTGRHSDVETMPAVTDERIAYLVARATATHRPLVAYCAMIGQPLY